MGFPANPSGRRLRYKSSTFQEYRTTLSRKFVFSGLPDVTSRRRTLRSRGCVPPRPICHDFRGCDTPDFKIFQSLVVWVVSGGMIRGASGAPRFCSFQDFQILAFRQISRAGVYSINHPLSKNIGRHLAEKFPIPNRRPARDVVSNLRIHTQRM